MKATGVQPCLSFQWYSNDMGAINATFINFILFDEEAEA